NVACGPDGTAAACCCAPAVVTDGTDIARADAEPSQSRYWLADPATVFGAGHHHGRQRHRSLRPDSPIRLELAGAAPAVVAGGPRVGVSKAADRPWRFWLPDRAEVSAFRRSPRAPAPGLSD
ncbi:DNA-3-methyladenine glycosylase, partial [Mycolicibacterium insubricum]|uniref:DNA-3-methyladenine glycosylase n=1 Tax=Mycolicibacterium insubricum TaxID=444597 RepID=UPI0021F2FEFB